LAETNNCNPPVADDDRECRVPVVQNSLLLAAAALTALTVHSAAHAQPGARPPHEMQAWLARHPEYRLLTDSDCRCDDDLREIRDERGLVRRPDYRPFFTTGDFNEDGQIDVAVGVARTADNGSFRVLIINSVDTPNSYRHAYLSKRFDQRYAIFFGPPAAEGRLLVGPFESEADRLIPRGRFGYMIGPVEY
jgi:hypothetical protein